MLYDNDEVVIEATDQIGDEVTFHNPKNPQTWIHSDTVYDLEDKR